MAARVKTTTSTPAVQAQVPGAIPGTTFEELAKAREQLFTIYPEIGSLYGKFGDPNTTLRADWFDKDQAVLIGKFVTLIKKLEIEELFPNWEVLKRIAELTDGGTINDTILRALETLCKKSLAMKAKCNDEIMEVRAYRDMAITLRNINLWDELGSENSILTKGLRMFGIDIKTLKDCIDTERLLDELGINSVD